MCVCVCVCVENSVRGKTRCRVYIDSINKSEEIINRRLSLLVFIFLYRGDVSRISATTSSSINNYLELGNCTEVLYLSRIFSTKIQNFSIFSLTVFFDYAYGRSRFF